MTIFGFVISLAVILLLSQRNLAIAIITGAILLGLFTIPPSVVLERIVFTITDLQIIILALAMGIIPILGGVMKRSGEIDQLVENLRKMRWKRMR
ncbi:MAG TPA: hypothetical protein EYP24_00295 [bacterium (Candidatus Stahlbacteria)]|nr:hypothetical protein [Candidatus Stahlbacteria bacterium]